MPSHSTAYRTWRALSIFGACLIGVGVGASYFDDATRFYFNMNYEIFAYMGLLGLLSAFVGCIAWAKYLEKSRLFRMAIVVFVLPWIALLVGYPFGGNYYHGPAGIVMMLMIPVTILAIILLTMAAFNPKQAPVATE